MYVVFPLAFNLCTSGRVRMELGKQKGCFIIKQLQPRHFFSFSLSCPFPLYPASSTEGTFFTIAADLYPTRTTASSVIPPARELAFSLILFERKLLQKLFHSPSTPPRFPSPQSYSLPQLRSLAVWFVLQKIIISWLEKSNHNLARAQNGPLLVGPFSSPKSL